MHNPAQEALELAINCANRDPKRTYHIHASDHGTRDDDPYIVSARAAAPEGYHQLMVVAPE